MGLSAPGSRAIDLISTASPNVESGKLEPCAGALSEQLARFLKRRARDVDPVVLPNPDVDGVR